MSIDRETNRIPAFVSFRGHVMSSGMPASKATASNMMASNVMAQDMILFVGFSNARVSCGFNRDLYPPSNLLSTPPSTH